MSALSDELVAANTSQLSARAIARAAQAMGHRLHHDTAARYLGGHHGRPDETTLIALAAVLDTPLANLRRAADLPSDVTEPYVPPAEASRLTRRQRRAVDELIRAMLDPGQLDPASRQQAAEVVQLPAPGTLAEAQRAARHGQPEPEQA